MPSRYTTVDTTYDDPRTGERVRERRIQEVPDDRIDYIRRRERAAFYGEPEKALVLRRDDAQANDEDDGDDYFANRRMVRRERFADDTFLPPTPGPRENGNSQRRSRRRDPTPPPPSDRPPSRETRRRRRHRRARSERPAEIKDNIPLDKNKLGEEGEVDAGRLWYSLKNRNEGNFFEKHFDSSYDGIFAAAAGAAIGAMGANRMMCQHGRSEEENKAIAAKSRWKTIAGGLAGAVAFNAGENWIRVYTEERLEHREHAMDAMEFMAEGIDGLMPKMV